MTREETLTVMSVLKAAYPSYYKGMDRRDAEGVVGLWQAMFADTPAHIVAAAVKAHIATDTKGYPPHIGAIKSAIVKITKPEELEMTEMEAWSLVRRAIHGASMEDWSRRFRDGVLDPRPSAVVSFEALPEMLQRIVGQPDRLAEWEKLDGDEIDTVIQSNFMRSFRARAAHEREFLALPTDVRETMKAIGGTMQSFAQLTGNGADDGQS